MRTENSKELNLLRKRNHRHKMQEETQASMA